MSRFRPVESATRDSISSQWDKLASIRDHQLRSEIDTSFHNTLKPYFVEKMSELKSDRLLDFGCGTGFLTEILSTHAKHTTGIDISKTSIAIARSSANRISNIKYVNADIIDIPDEHNDEFNTITANMVLQDVLDLNSVVKAIYNKNKKNGYFIFSITHPWFWPFYWGYNEEQWFSYDQEIAIESPFLISNEQSTTESTVHFHRPLNLYIDSLKNAKYEILKIDELFSDGQFKYPKFLGFVCKKI